MHFTQLKQTKQNDIALINISFALSLSFVKQLSRYESNEGDLMYYTNLLYICRVLYYLSIKHHCNNTSYNMTVSYTVPVMKDVDLSYNIIDY